MQKIIKPVTFGLLVAHCLSLLIAPATPEKAVVFGILAIMVGYFEFKSEQKHLVDLKAELETLKLDLLEQKKFSQELSSHVSSIKMGQQIKSVGRF